MVNLKGCFTALITPFDPRGILDKEGLSALIQRQIKNQINGIVVLGTTGESPTLSDIEKNNVISIARKEIPKETIFIVGTGSFSTAQTIEDSQYAQDHGADAILVITPYYNRPTQEGLYRHFKSLASAISIPIILYNQPLRTGQNLNLETFKRLIEIQSIIGIKEASGNMSQIVDTLELVRQKRPNFYVLSGDDAITLPSMSLGADGVVSVASNLFPKEMRSLVDSALAEDIERARHIHYQLLPFFKATGLETNPIPIKAALKLCGLPSGECRLPLCELGDENYKKLEKLLLDSTTSEMSFASKNFA